MRWSIMSKERFDVLERFAPLFETPEPSFERFLRRRDRKRRNQRIAAGVVAIAVFVAPIAFFAGLISSDRSETPGALGTSVPEGPQVDYLINLNTGVVRLLPSSILESLGSPRTRSPSLPAGEPGQYAASPDGSKLAYVGIAEDGSRQIFTAWIDGRRVRQVTHEPNGASWPAWSPDGTRIAYVRYGGGNFRNISVLDVRTGQFTEVTHGARTPFELQFTPDGTSIIYTDGPGPNETSVWTVPATGGRSTVLIGPGEGVSDVGNASLSPDGSLVTFLGSGSPRSDPSVKCGPCRFLANADGTDRRIIPGWVSNPAGTWSPDGSRIVCLGTGGNRIVVVDIATGEATPVAEGSEAIWLDNHTLLVEV
jgi:Tol biopolymer transport system component